MQGLQKGHGRAFLQLSALFREFCPGPVDFTTHQALLDKQKYYAQAMDALRLWLVVTPETEALDVVGPAEVFATANQYGAEYQWQLVSWQQSVLRSRSGLQLGRACPLAEAEAQGPPHSLLIAGGPPRFERDSPSAQWARWLQANHQKIPRIGSVCTGAFVLAEAGLLDRQRATTHWRYRAALRSNYPRIQVEQDTLYLRSDKFWTSAGISSGIDMALALVQEDFGHSIALKVAKHLVLPLHRPGNQSQFSESIEAAHSSNQTIRTICIYISQHLSQDLDSEKLSHQAHMSPRSLTRLFKKELGCTPAAYVRQQRLQKAKLLIETTGWGLKEIAHKTGFGDESTLRRRFQNSFGLSPSYHRERFQA